jgi:bifunctional DNase/RNase
MLVEMSIKGLMIDPVTNMPIVILRDADNQRALPSWVGPVEANAIALQIENVAPQRPMTHDLLRTLLVELGTTLVRVVIADLREGTFYAYLELSRDGETIFVDARPMSCSPSCVAAALRACAGSISQLATSWKGSQPRSPPSTGSRRARLRSQRSLASSKPPRRPLTYPLSRIIPLMRSPRSSRP